MVSAAIRTFILWLQYSTCLFDSLFSKTKHSSSCRVFIDSMYCHIINFSSCRMVAQSPRRYRNNLIIRHRSSITLIPNISNVHLALKFHWYAWLPNVPSKNICLDTESRFDQQRKAILREMCLQCRRNAVDHKDSDWMFPIPCYSRKHECQTLCGRTVVRVNYGSFTITIHLTWRCRLPWHLKQGELFKYPLSLLSQKRSSPRFGLHCSILLQGHSPQLNPVFRSQASNKNYHKLVVVRPLKIQQ